MPLQRYTAYAEHRFEFMAPEGLTNAELELVASLKLKTLVEAAAGSGISIWADPEESETP